MNLKTFITIILFISSSMPFFGQKKYQPSFNGTIIIAAIASDGIIIASDSRLSIVDETEKTIAYLDKVQKLFPLHKYVFALAGNPMIGKVSIEHSLTAFSHQNTNFNNPQETLYNILSFLAKTYPTDYDIFTKNRMYVCGFNLGFKIATNDGGHVKFFRDSGYISNYNRLIDSLSLFNYSPLKSCNQLKPLLIKAVRSIGELRKEKHSIGGPISILMIDENNKVKWLSEQFKNNFDSKCKLANSYFTNPSTFKLIKPSYKKLLDTLMKNTKNNNCY